MSAGPLRNKYIHRIVAAALLGRELDKSEEVHHKDGNKLNFHHSNLMVVGHEDHSWVSAKQAWYMREQDRKAKAEWDSFMHEQGETFDREVAAARSAGAHWQGHDGRIQQAWAAKQSRPSSPPSPAAL